MKFWPVFNYSHHDLEEFRDNFFTELTQLGQPNCGLPGFVTQLPDAPFVLEDEVFEVVSIGGTNFSWARVVNSMPLQVFESQNDKLPNLNTLADFRDFLVSKLAPEVSKIVINFAYPLQPAVKDDRLDGRLIFATKEHTMIGLVGELVGQTLETSISQQIGRIVKITVANDVVCLLQQPFALNEISLAGGVVGTGFNFGFHRNVDEVYNLESGSFSNFRPTPTGLAVDQNSHFPGQQLWEKEVSGAYLYQHYNLIALEKGWNTIQSTVELNLLSKSPSHQGLVARELLERSASLVASEMAAIYKFMDVPKVNFVIEGNLFWSGRDYLLKVRKTLASLGVDPTEQIVILQAQSPLTGAIALGVRDEEVAI
jgi:hexokinase